MFDESDVKKVVKLKLARGKPSKGTKKDMRLKKNRKRKKR